MGDGRSDAGEFDEEFCRQVEQRMGEFALPVSDACNARLQPPPPHFAKFLATAAQHQAAADIYTSAFNYPDRVWRILSNAERTEWVTKLLTGGPAPVPFEWAAVSALSSALGARG